MNFKLAFRSIKKNKLHSFICILGLGIGIGSIVLLSVLYLHDTSFNQFIPEHSKVYRVLRGDNSLVAYPLVEKVTADNPSVKDYIRFYQKENVNIKDTQNDIREEDHFAFADANIFNFWGVNLLEGNSARNSSEIAISKSIKDKYFGVEDAVGKVLKIKINEEFLALNICGVYQDFPSNSTINPEFVANIDLLTKDADSFNKKIGEYAKGGYDFKGWDEFKFESYVRLIPGADPNRITQFLQQYKSYTTNEKRQKLDFSLQSVDTIYLESENIENKSFSRVGNKKDLNYYLAIAAIILFIAIINYVLLTNAKVNKRLKELGAQKALGAYAKTLMGQIIIESNIVAALSLIPAIIILIVGIPFVNQVLDQSVDITVFYSIQTWLLLVGMVYLLVRFRDC